MSRILRAESLSARGGPPELARDGITADALRIRLEQRLQEANIKIDAGVREFVGLRVASVRDHRGPYALALTIGLYQPVWLARDSNLRAAPETWDVETVLMADAKIVQRAALQTVDQLARRFLTAYRSANP